MDTGSKNPFLADNHPAIHDTNMFQQASNPFLGVLNESPPTSTPISENPFLSFSEDQSYNQAINSTNPFSSFTVPSTELTPEVGNSLALNIPKNDINSSFTNIFRDETEQTEDIFSSSFGNSKKCAKGSNNSTFVSSRYTKTAPSLSSENTKDLILSVTGAMDATSSQMLDRLQNTKTPSPTPLHSPSPTPEHSLADLLDVEDDVADLSETEKRIHGGDNCQDNTGLTEATNSVPLSVGSTSESNILSTDSPYYTLEMQENEFTAIESGTLVDYHIDISSTEKNLPSAQVLCARNLPIGTSNVFSVTAEETEHHCSAQKTLIIPTDVKEKKTFKVESLEDLAVSEMLDKSSANISTSGAILNSPFAEGKNAYSRTTEVQSSLLRTDTPISVNDESPLTIAETTPILHDRGINHSGISDAGLSKHDLHRDNMLDSSTTRTAIADTFDAFASKFDGAAELNASTSIVHDPFASGSIAMDTSSDVWGDCSAASLETAIAGFGETDGFDSFLSMTAPPQMNLIERSDSVESNKCPDFSVYIKPKESKDVRMTGGEPVPFLAPPPASSQSQICSEVSSRFNPFDKTGGFVREAVVPTTTHQTGAVRTDSEETPPTPLFDEDISQPLEEFPRVDHAGDGWDMQLRQPNKKKITGQRFWKKVFIRLLYQGDHPVVQLFHNKDDNDPFQELPLLPCYSVSDIGAQQFDQYGKIFTVKLQYIFYKERPGVRPGQVTKAERLTNKLSQFAAYAIQGDYQGVKEFGSDLKKLGLPVEHSPQISQLLKIGSQNYEEIKEFSSAVEEALFRLPAHRDRALQYKMEEVQIAVVDELYVEQNVNGHVEKQTARVRLFFLGFLSGMPDVELGINDMRRQGKEVVGRHDIIPMVTEEWIRLENVEFHYCIQQDEYEDSKIIRFKPPDACYIELMRFRVRPPKNRELPLQLKCIMCVTGNKVEIRADILVPGFTSRKLGQIPCEDVMVRIPIPECWIYLFRVEKHFRYGSVKSAHRRTGKIKGIERFLGAVENLEPQLMEATSGQAKYEHQHKAIVWRMPRLPKEGQGAYTTHQLVCRLALTSYDQIPANLANYCYVEFTMPATQVSHTTARSVSFRNHDSDDPPEKYVRNLSRHEYRVAIEHSTGEGPGAYVSATLTKKIPESTLETHQVSGGIDSDSDSSE